MATIAESITTRKQKGMEDFMKLLGTGVKVGKTIGNIATGNWVGAVANWIPQVNSIKGALDAFTLWKNGRGF